MSGVILGDVVGSVYEFKDVKSYNFEMVSL